MRPDKRFSSFIAVTMHTLVKIQSDSNVKMNDQRQEQMNQIKIMSHEYILLARYIFSAKTSHEAKNRDHSTTMAPSTVAILGLAPPTARLRA